MLHMVQLAHQARERLELAEMRLLLHSWQRISMRIPAWQKLYLETLVSAASRKKVMRTHSTLQSALITEVARLSAGLQKLLDVNATKRVCRGCTPSVLRGIPATSLVSFLLQSPNESQKGFARAERVYSPGGSQVLWRATRRV